MKAQYAAWPAGAALQQDYSACYPIPAFTRHGVAYDGTEAQPEFTANQRKEIEAQGGVIFDGASAFLEWQNS